MYFLKNSLISIDPSKPLLHEQQNHESTTDSISIETSTITNQPNEINPTKINQQTPNNKYTSQYANFKIIKSNQLPQSYPNMSIPNRSIYLIDDDDVDDLDEKDTLKTEGNDDVEMDNNDPGKL